MWGAKFSYSLETNLIQYTQLQLTSRYFIYSNLSVAICVYARFEIYQSYSRHLVVVLRPSRQIPGCTLK